MNKKILLLPVLMLVSSLEAYTLTGTIKHSLKGNPAVKARLENYEKAIYDLNIAKSEFLPKLDFTGRYGYTYQLSGGRDFVYKNSLTLMQNLFDGFKTTNQIKVEESKIMAAAYNYVEFVNDTVLNISRYYIDMLKNKELLDLDQQVITFNQDILSKTNELTKSNSGRISDLSKIDSSLQLAEYNYLVRKNNLMDTKFNLQKYTGTIIDENQLEQPNYNLNIVGGLNESILYAIEHNPSVIVGEYKIKTAQAKLKRDKSKYYPSLDLELNYNIDRIGDKTNKYYESLLKVKFNIFNGFADKYTIDKHKSSVRFEQNIKRDIKRQVTQGLELSYSAFTMLKQQIPFLESYIAKTEKTLDLYKKEFRIGTRSLNDLLLAHNEYITAKSKLVTAKYDLMFSKYRILDARGELVNKLLDQEYVNDFYSLLNTNMENTISSDFKISKDEDKDKIIDTLDICDNTPIGKNTKVNAFGCVLLGK